MLLSNLLKKDFRYCYAWMLATLDPAVHRRCPVGLSQPTRCHAVPRRGAYPPRDAAVRPPMGNREQLQVDQRLPRVDDFSKHRRSSVLLRLCGYSLRYVVARWPAGAGQPRHWPATETTRACADIPEYRPQGGSCDVGVPRRRNADSWEISLLSHSIFDRIIPGMNDADLRALTWTGSSNFSLHPSV